MADEAPKRGRGRPKGSTNATRPPATPTGPASGVAKRGRGGPKAPVNKKQPKSAVPKKKVVKAAPVAGRGRGRPKKEDGAASTTKSAVESTAKSGTGRGRGRPKKLGGPTDTPKSAKAATPKSGKKRGRPSKAAAAAVEDAEVDEDVSKDEVFEVDDNVDEPPVVSDDKYDERSDDGAPAKENNESI